MLEIGPGAARELLRSSNACLLLDVREEWELRIATIEGARHIPMQEVPGRVAEIDVGGAVIVFCHHGVRSALVARYLERSGYERVFNLEGGIDAWSREVDQSLAVY